MQLDGKQKHRIRIGGSLKFSSLPSETQNAIKLRIASKDPMMRGALKAGALPGIKIDGKVVTKENVHEFEIKSSNKKSKNVEKGNKSKKYTREELVELDFKDLKIVGKKFGTTDRSKKKLIEEILDLQGVN